MCLFQRRAITRFSISRVSQYLIWTKKKNGTVLLEQRIYLCPHLKTVAFLNFSL